MVAGDFNDDGWPDLYLSIFGAPNRLFLNNGQGGFEDATTKEIGDPGEAFGVAVGDIDNDGALDIFQAAGGGNGRDLSRSLMLLNLGDGQFVDFTEGVGLPALTNVSLLSTRLVDIDNDGDLDLLTGNSQPFSLTDNAGDLDSHFLFLNDGDGFFTDATDQSGLSEVELGLVIADYDRDGFLDVASRRKSGRTNWGGLFRNTGNDNHYLRVELVGVESNRSGIGARLTATAGDLVQVRELLGGNGFTMNEPVVHFGVGDRSQVDRLEIRWPSGRVDVLNDIPANQQIRVFEGQTGYHAVQPTVWEQAPPEILSSGCTIDLTAVVRPALFSSDATVTQVQADLSALGGPAAVPLVATGDGTHRLETRLTVTSDLGLKSLIIRIEQETDFGPYWTTLARQVSVAPQGDLGLFYDGAEEGWNITVQWLDNLTQSSWLDLFPSWFEEDQKIAFLSNRDGDWEIFSMDADFANPVNLTNNSATELSSLSTSPDGQKIIFHSNRAGQGDLYIMNGDGSNPVRLTDDPVTENWAHWSPDGRRIVYHAYRGEGNSDIFMMDADGSNHIQLTADPAADLEPSWSPDGERIVFTSDREGSQDIFVMQADGSNPIQLTRHIGRDAQPQWSPDGRRIAFSSDEEIYMMDADGANKTRLTHHSGFNQLPKWWPDGQRMAFTSDRDGPWDIFVMEWEGTERVTLDPLQREVVYKGDTALQIQADEGLWKVLFQTAEGEAGEGGEESAGVSGFEVLCWNNV